MIVVLHIGLPKTATTVLQAALAANFKELRCHGVDYPDRFRDDREHIAHHKLPVILRTQNTEERDACIAEVLLSLEATTSQRVIFSSEDISNLFAPRYVESFWELIRCLQRKADVHIVVALRRLDQMFESMYLHSVKTGDSQVDIDTYLQQRHYWASNFFEQLAKLRITVGNNNIHIIKYEKDSHYMRQLLGALGIDETWLSSEKARKGRKNAKLSLKQQIILRHLSEISDRIGARIDRRHLIQAFESSTLTFPNDDMDYTVLPPLWSMYYQASSLRWAAHHAVLEYYDAFSNLEIRVAPPARLEISALSTIDYCLLYDWQQVPPNSQHPNIPEAASL